MGATSPSPRDRPGAGPSSTLVVGGAGGLGSAIVDRLCRDGHHVVVVDRDSERCAALAERLGGGNSPTRVCEGDAADPDLMRSLLDELESSGLPVSGLVHCAATAAEVRSFRALPLAEWDRVLRDSLTSAFVCAQAVVRHMAPRAAGRIVFISSVVALRQGGSIDDIAYTAAKGAMHSMVGSLARSLGRRSITVNAVAPGLVRTPLTAVVMDERIGGTVEASWKRSCPMGRPCEPDEVAGVVSFLLSPDASFVSGTVIPIDGAFRC